MSSLHAFTALFGVVAEDINILTVGVVGLLRIAAVGNDLCLKVSRFILEVQIVPVWIGLGNRKRPCDCFTIHLQM